MLLNPESCSHLTKNVRIPKVSIGMPVYNGEPFIRKAIDSLLAQTFTDFELIISDNASTDGTRQICKEYAAKDTRIEYIRQPINKGPVANFQFVCEKSHGEYFMWAAADDLWNEACLAKWVNILDSQRTAVLAFSDFYTFNHITNKAISESYVGSSVGTTSENRLLSRMINPVSNLIYGLFRKKAFDISIIDTFDFFDVYFGYYMAVKGRIFIIHDFLFYAGIKNSKRTPYSITGNNITVLPFFIKTKALIRSKIKPVKRLFFYSILLRQCLLMHRTYSLASKNTQNPSSSLPPS